MLVEHMQFEVLQLDMWADRDKRELVPIQAADVHMGCIQWVEEAQKETLLQVPCADKQCSRLV